MKLFQRALLAFSFLIVAVNSNAQLAVLDGNWYSTQWKYGYVLKDGVGMATSTNSPNFQVGQNIIQLTATSPNTFTGQQVYTDGKFYRVNAKLQADGRLYFEGEKNAKWVMDRIGAAPQASAPSSQSTQPTTSAAASASTSPSFDCRKATTAVEKLICSNPDLSKLDVSLAETYKEAVSKDRSIRDDQRNWHIERNNCADVDCLKTAYEDRISELTNFIVRYDRAALNQAQPQAPAPRNMSPAERLALQMGPNKTAGCLSVSFRFIGLFSGGATGSELAAARNLYIRYAEVFAGVSKLQDKSQFDAQMNGFRESVKQASPQNLKDYFESNCSQPEVNQLVQTGWK
jgi:uncharacterized protein YecT (DUF1311 family)